ncbi:hypothetical protein FDUTEX481_02057 [Tolypothrix sp. PCC 7601]|nr:hypothetical protein FDUTEX481_02057 [Tolypothrix sp. PCC 7601]BAY90779.1 hypothetical protein NIES3275_27960 [Microchaete diplosiphon NIES-3275]
MRIPMFKPARWVIWTMLCIVGGILIGALHVNIVPYQKLAASFLAPSAGDPNSGFGFLRMLPGFGGLAAALGLVSAYIIGAFAYALVQFLELAPNLIHRSPRILKGLLASSGGQKYAPKDGDKGTVKRIKKSLGQGLIWALAHLEAIKSLSYVFDAFICFIAYPFIKDLTSVGDFFGVFLTGQWNRIDWQNLLLFAITVYGVEFLLKLIWALQDVEKASRTQQD